MQLTPEVKAQLQTLKSVFGGRFAIHDADEEAVFSIINKWLATIPEPGELVVRIARIEAENAELRVRLAEHISLT